MDNRIAIDGSEGEGGGQLLRTALALALVTGRAFRIERIRAGRRKTGLLRQHLTAVRAAAEISGASVSGADLGSDTLVFEPGRVKGGEYKFAVGTAGSATLVFQAVLPALLMAPESSRIVFEGGTHNPYAPPFDFLARSFLPVLRRMGAIVDVRLDAYGFYPAGGGRFTAVVEPCRTLEPLSWLERGETRVSARAVVASLSERIGKREIAIVRERFGLARETCRVEVVDGPIGPGNVLMIAVESAGDTAIVTGFGEKGVSAETVAGGACDEALRFLDAGVPVCPHLADQLLIPMAIASGGAFRTVKPTAHTMTNAAVIRQFLDVSIAVRQEGDDVYEISVGHPKGRES